MPAHAIKLFLTDLLFSSPRLRFSEQQKRAVLSWASQLGARDVPTYYMLSRFQEGVKNIVGNSVISVTTGTGHKVFMQDIPHLIAKVSLASSWFIDPDPAGMRRTTRILSLGLQSGTTPLMVKGAFHKYSTGQKCLLTCRLTLWYPLYALRIAYFLWTSSSKLLMALILFHIAFSINSQKERNCQAPLD
jgi:hypothetical protein